MGCLPVFEKMFVSQDNTLLNFLVNKMFLYTLKSWIYKSFLNFFAIYHAPTTPLPLTHFVPPFSTSGPYSPPFLNPSAWAPSSRKIGKKGVAECPCG